MAVQTQIQVRRGTASSWTSTNPTLAAGEIGFESDTGKIKVGTGSATWNSLTYIGAANAIQYVYNASAGQTTFSGADANGATLAYTVGAEQVYVNGVLQVRNTDYTATNGTSVVLTTATIASDIVTVVALGTFTVADTYTQAQANATFPLNTSAFFAGKNKIINGDFNVWQRGTSFTNPADNAFTADRWRQNSNTVGRTATWSQQTFTPGTAPVAGYEGTYYLRYNQTVAGSSSSYQNILVQPIEDVRTFAGQVVTISFWARSATNGHQIGTTPYQTFGSGGSPDPGGPSTTFTLTTSWVRYSTTVTVPSIAGKTIGTNSSLQLLIYTINGNQVQQFDIWGVQMEAGSVATAFQTATGTIQGELAACQRYYQRFDKDVNYSILTQLASAISTTQATLPLNLKTNMRVTPTTIDWSNISLSPDNYSTAYALTTLVVGSYATSSNVTLLGTVASGLTQFRPYFGHCTTSGYIGIGAEL